MKRYLRTVLSIALTLSMVITPIDASFAGLFSNDNEATEKEEILMPESPVPVDLAESESVSEKDIKDAETQEQEPVTFEEPAYNADTIAEEAEAEQEYRESVDFVDNTIIFSVLDYRKPKAKAVYLNDADTLCKTNGLKKVTLVLDVKTDKAEKKEGLEAHQVFYSATIKTDDVWKAVDTLSEVDGVMSAEPDFIWESAAQDDMQEVTPEELEFSSWAENDIDCPEIWGSLTEGSAPGENVVVAVIDTGVDYTHNDLKDSMWVNPGEVADNGIDDDGNGYVDDVHGINLIDPAKQGNPMDDMGHGTHVAGIIAMSPGNGGGVGIAYGAKIMAVKAGQANGSFASTDIARAIQYSAANGADVINMSFGGTGNSSLVEAALEDAFGSCVLVAAAGNDGAPTSDAFPLFIDGRDIYPAGYSYVIGVMACNGNSLAEFSNWDYIIGRNCEYEIAAPGVQIESSLPGNKYAKWSGTSMAAPVISAAAAIIRRNNPDKSKYSSRYIAGQLVGATSDTVSYIDRMKQIHMYPELNFNDCIFSKPLPKISVSDMTMFDSKNIAENNNNDGLFQAGETIDLGLRIRNQWGTVKDVEIKVDANSHSGEGNPYIELINDSIELNKEIGTFATADNGYIYEDEYLIGVNNPIRFKIADNAPNDYPVTLNITVTGENGLDDTDNNLYSYNTEYSFTITKGTFLRGTISEDKTLTKDKLWIIDRPVLIAEGVTVNVDPGTHIQFYSDDTHDEYAEQHQVYIKVDGIFNCNGTEDEPVKIYPNKTHYDYFVSIFDGDARLNNGVGWVDTGDDWTRFNKINMLYSDIINPYIVVNRLDHANVQYVYDDYGIHYYEGYDGQVQITEAYGTISANEITHSNFCNIESMGHNNGTPTRFFTHNMDTSIINNSYTKCEQYGEYDVLPQSTIMNSVWLKNRSDCLSVCGITLKPFVSFENNAILELLNGKWPKVMARQGAIIQSDQIQVPNNYWGTINESYIEKLINDNKDDLSVPAIDYKPTLTIASDMSSIYPFVVDAYLTDEYGNNRLDTVSCGQAVQLHILFNRDMANGAAFEPLVTFGPEEPYTDYIVNGEWANNREWVGSIIIDPLINQGIEYIRIKDAVAADDHWLKTGTDAARFSFSITKNSAEALTLQGNGGSNCNYLNWIQDDFDTLAGYNLYKSTSFDKSVPIEKQRFKKLNTSIIADYEFEYTDTDVEQGQDYYYYFTVVDTDFNESEPSNVVKCTPLDEESPQIATRAIGTQIVGRPVTIVADITDNVEVTGASLHYKMSDSDSWTDVQMRNTTGNTYQAVISGYDVKEGTMQYYITAEDGTNTSYAGTADVPNVFTVEGVVSAQAVTLDKTSAELNVGDTTTINATIFPENVTDKGITWTTSDENVATVDSDGNVTAVGIGNAYITATSQDGKASAICSITVSPVLVSEITLDSSEPTVQIGGEIVLTPTIAPDNATNKELTWESSDPRIATVDETGKVTAVSVGQATITARATDDSGIETNCVVTVTPIAVKAISITPLSATLDIDETLQLTANVYPDNATNKNVIWTSNNTNVATVDNGLVTATGGGNAVITATTEDGLLSAICIINVNPIIATDITLSQYELTLNTGDKATLTVTKQPANATINTYDWKSSDKTVAKVIGGVVTAVAPGEAYIYCTTTDGSDITKACRVEVYEKQAKPDAPEVLAKTLNMVILKKVEGALYSSDGENWTDSNRFTGLTGNTEYSFYIKMARNGYYLESDPSDPTLVVTENSSSTIDGIAVEPENAVMVVGDKLQIDVTIVPENTNVALEWSSTEPSIATVDDNGLVTALATGHTYIICKVSGITAVCNVKVYGQDDVPDIPDVERTTESLIKLTSVAGLQYRINNETWSDDSTLTGLEADTEYNVSVRLAANSYHKASEPASMTIRTAEHVLSKKDSKEATCTEDGNIEYWTCSECGKYFSNEEGTEELEEDDLLIKATGHDFGEWTTSKEATCTEAGLMERACSRCEEKETITLDPTGHKWKDDITVDIAPTYESTGTGSKHCKYCDAIKPDSEVVIPVLEKPEEWLQAIADKDEAIAAANAANSALQTAQKNLAAAQTTINELNDTIDSKDTTIEEKEAALQQAQTDLATANTALQKAQDDLTDANSQLEAANTRITELQETLGGKEQALEQALEDLSEAQQALADKQSELDTMTTNYNSTKALLDTANETITVLRGELDEANTSLAKAQEDLIAVNTELVAAQAAEKAAKEEAASANQRVSELEQAKSELESQLATSQGETAAVQNELDRVQRELTDAQAAKDLADQAAETARLEKEAAEKRALDAEARLEEIIKADEEAGKKNLKNAVVEEITDEKYTGKELTPEIKVTLNDKVLTAGVDFTAYYISNVNVGTATVLVAGEGEYVGLAKTTFNIVKGDNTMTARAKTQTVKYKKLKSKTQTIAKKKAFVIKSPQGKVTFKVTKYDKKAKKKITVSKTGKITVKKGLKKGKYKLTVAVKAAGTANYMPLTKKITLKITVK